MHVWKGGQIVVARAISQTQHLGAKQKETLNRTFVIRSHPWSVTLVLWCDCAADEFHVLEFLQQVFLRDTRRQANMGKSSNNKKRFSGQFLTMSRCQGSEVMALFTSSSTTFCSRSREKPQHILLGHVMFFLPKYGRYTRWYKKSDWWNPGFLLKSIVIWINSLNISETYTPENWHGT